MTSGHFDDVGAYLLGALSEDERNAFEEELAVNDALRAEVDYLQVAADALPASPEQMAPPPELKGRIMAVVHAEAKLLAAAQPELESDAPREQRRLAVLRPGWWSMRPGLALAMTLLVLVVGASGALVGEAVFGGGDRVTAAELGDAQLIQRESGHSTLTAANLEPLADGRVYQVWLKHEGEPPAPTDALFSPHSSGTASVDVPGSLDGVEEVLVTKEPEGGSAAPTSDAVIRVLPS